MKFKDLTKEEQEHFLEVVKYCQDNDLRERLNEATHIGFNYMRTSLTKSIEDVEYYYDNGFKGWLINPCPSSLYLKPKDYKHLLENQNESETMYKLKIIYKNNPEVLTLNFTEEQESVAKELFNTIKSELIKLSSSSKSSSIIESDLAFVIVVNEIASVFLNEM